MIQERTAKSIFLAAIEEHRPDDWPAFLDEACGNDRPLREQVEKLLGSHRQLGTFHEAPSDLVATVEPPAMEQLGARIGPYKLRELLGEGGMGVVYVAEQEQPIRRKVALKIVKPGMDSRQVIARFEAERQALALMDHPNIARVLDAGTTHTGRPYFAMDLVRGVPITQFCDERKLTTRERLSLFALVCRAIQHAHQKGIIHRDIKPTNVLVTLHDDLPVPKVIDFGIAKATSQPLSDKSVYTAFTQMVGTPLYMSPEQAEMNALDVDTRSDVYSLGVLLYELLTGTTPFDKDRLQSAGFDEMRRIIREEEPETVSQRLSKTHRVGSAHQRPATVARLSDSGGHSPPYAELDWIVCRCLEKDRARRYESASSLAADIQRYLSDEPVHACPPSVGYRLRKFARRNKRVLAVVALLTASLFVAVGGVAGSIGWARRDLAARRAEAALEQQIRDSEREQEIGRALDEAILYRDRRDWIRATAALRRAEWLRDQGTSDRSGQRMVEIARDLRMAMRLEELYIEDPQHPYYNVLDRSSVDPLYLEAFQNYGINVEVSDVGTAAERIRASAIRSTLVAGLNDWMWIKLCKLYNYQFFQYRPDIKTSERQVLSEYERLRSVADLADPDECSRRVRDPQVQRDLKELEKLAAQPEVRKNPSVALFLARLLHINRATRQAIVLLSALQEQDPADFLVNYSLGILLSFDKTKHQEAIGFLRVAVALRPQYPYLRLKLSQMLGSVK